MNKIKSTEFSERLKRLLKTNAVTQKELAEAIGVSGAAVTGWVKGAVPTSDKLSSLARFFKTSTDELLTGHAPDYEGRAEASKKRAEKAAQYADRMDAPHEVQELGFNYSMAQQLLADVQEELFDERERRQKVMVELLSMKARLGELIEDLREDVITKRKEDAP